MTDKQTPATPKLIPDSLASALQSVVSVAAISTIDTGDRSLNAALGTLITVGFTLTLERLQKFTSWKHLGTTALSSLQLNSLLSRVRCATRNRMIQGKGETDFDFYSVPEPTNVLFKHVYRIQSSIIYFTLKEWMIQTYGHNKLFNLPTPKSIIEDKNYSYIHMLPVCIEQEESFPREKFIPIWYSQRQFIYFKISGVHESLFCNSESVLHEFLKMIEQKHIKRIETIKTASSFLGYVEGLPSLSKPLRRELLNPQKTFECMFFEQKTELLEMLTRFKNSDMYAKHLGIDNTLGILLYGPPGTGKTMCCNAIANFLRRNIVQATVKEMRQKEAMDSLFDYRTKIVLFDEFDCLLDVIKSRDTADRKQSDEDGNPVKLKIAMKFLDMAHAEKDEEKKKALMTQYESTLNQDDGKVDLQYLLTKFQGLESADGRCIIACTNHPDKIDSALKRKGRFDIIIKLGNATPRMIFDMVSYYFQVTDDEKEELEKQFTELPNRLISPAELQDICASSNGPKETLEKVMARASFASDNASVISEDSQTISVGTSNPHD